MWAYKMGQREINSRVNVILSKVEDMKNGKKINCSIKTYDKKKKKTWRNEENIQKKFFRRVTKILSKIQA